MVTRRRSMASAVIPLEAAVVAASNKAMNEIVRRRPATIVTNGRENFGCINGHFVSALDAATKPS